MRPPSAVTSVRTASMPTPRPASSVTSSVVVKPGVKIRLASSASVGVASGAIRPLLAAARLDALQVEAGAVVADLDPHFVALLRQRDVDRADRILVLRAARVAATRCRARRQLRSKCSNAPAMRSSTLRSSSIDAAFDVQAHLH